MAVERPELIACECGGEGFLTVVSLTRYPGRGVTTKPTGYVCQSCNKMLDMDRQAKLAVLRKRQAELEAVEAEIAELES